MINIRIFCNHLRKHKTIFHLFVPTNIDSRKCQSIFLHIGIHFWRFSMILSQNSQYDPFKAKVTESHKRLDGLLKVFKGSTTNSDILSSDTTIIYLVLQSNIRLSDNQIKTILGLEIDNEVHDIIFSGIEKQVRYSAEKILSDMRLRSLLEMPLTDLKHLCYEIALNFKSIFFVPVESKIAHNTPPSASSTPPRSSHYAPRSLVQFHTASRLETYILSSLRPPSRPHSSTYSDSDNSLPRVHSRDESYRNEVDYVDIIQFISKFNQMWIIAAFLDREYDQLRKNSISPGKKHPVK